MNGLSLIQDLALVLLAAGVAGALCRKLGLSVIVGYLVAGIIIGPYNLPFTYIQANVFMISGCQDSQTSADVSNVSSFSLPNPNGRAGGACTSALLKGKWSVAWSLV